VLHLEDKTLVNRKFGNSSFPGRVGVDSKIFKQRIVCDLHHSFRFGVRVPCAAAAISSKSVGNDLTG